MYISDTPVKRFIQERLEPIRSQPELQRRAAQAHPRAPDGGRDARALPAHQVRRPEALLGRGRRLDDPDARPPDPARRRRRRPGDRDGHGAPRSAQRAGQHAGQDAIRPVLGVRGQGRAGAARGRRQVPPGLLVRRVDAGRAGARDARVQSVAPRDRQPGGRGQRARAPAPARATRAATRCCRC